MKGFLLVLTVTLSAFMSKSQEADSSSSKQLPEITITAFEQQRSKLGTVPSLVGVSMASIDRSNRTSLLSALNSIAGVRMEERSPGSYRLNIRGSSLRAPFGVRNVKVYWNDIPVTDAGGGTYFNQFAFNNISSLEIAKGPAGSLYGAGTGGLILLTTIDKSTKPGLMADIAGGSFGMQNILVTGIWGNEKNKSQLSYAHNKTDGYRNHTLLKRDNFSYSSQFKISDKQEVKANILFNSMFYETPGGLNANEYSANPRQERPAAGAFPSASSAKAAINQVNFIAGISHLYKFSTSFQNNTILFGIFNRIQNPSFRNYERRIEPGFGGRTVFKFDKNWTGASLRWVAGAEIQQAYYNTQVSKNKAGNPDTLQTNDDINLTAYSVFTQVDLEFGKGWIITAGTSLNKSSLSIKRLNIYPVSDQKRNYRNELSPRVSVIKKFGSLFSLSGVFSKGFSPPTIAEVLPSTGVISTSLEAEKGTNFELGARLNLFSSRLQIDLTAFNFSIDDALVIRRDASNADFFVNAGNVKQKGMEASLQYYFAFDQSTPLLSQLVIRNAHSWYNFKYGSFQKDQTSFDGKKLPGVPGYSTSISADIQFKAGISLALNYFHASSIFLNDANTVKDEPYSIAGARVSYGLKFNKGSIFTIYSGVDNLFNELYSLGNDINAAAGRFYNVAPGRNWYIGLRMALGVIGEK